MNTKIIETNQKKIQEQDLEEISKEISNGKIIILDTKTNYKLIASLENKETTKKIQSLAKEQQGDNQKHTILISNYIQLSEITEYIPNEIFRTINAFWPGPLIIILKPSKDFSNKTNIKEQIQVSMPKSKIIKSIIDKTGPLLSILLSKEEENKKDSKSKNNKNINKIKKLKDKIKYTIKTNKIDKTTIINGIEKPYNIIEEGEIKEHEIKQYLKNTINIKQN